MGKWKESGFRIPPPHTDADMKRDMQLMDMFDSVPPYPLMYRSSQELALRLQGISHCIHLYPSKCAALETASCTAIYAPTCTIKYSSKRTLNHAVDSTAVDVPTLPSFPFVPLGFGNGCNLPPLWMPQSVLLYCVFARTGQYSLKQSG